MHKKIVVILLAAVGVNCFAVATPQAPEHQKPILELTQAKKIAAAAHAYAAQHDWPCAIAIVDDGGWPILAERMDNAPVVAGIELAQAKAKSAAIFKRGSDDLEASVNHGRAAALSSGFVMMKGAQPIKSGGTVIGAIGISGDTPEHDSEIALAALAVKRQ